MTLSKTLMSEVTSQISFFVDISNIAAFEKLSLFCFVLSHIPGTDAYFAWRLNIYLPATPGRHLCF